MELDALKLDHSRAIELLKITLSWEPGNEDVKSSLLTTNRISITSPEPLPTTRVDFANLNEVALKRLKTATEMSEQLRKTQETASKFEQAFEVILSFS